MQTYGGIAGWMWIFVATVWTIIAQRGIIEALAGEIGEPPKAIIK
jgi:hypothetical protein